MGEQFESLRVQARNFWLARNVPVSTMLCSDTRRYDDFIRDFDQKSRRAQFPDNIRPHGILLDTIKGVSEGSLICNDNSRRPVRGTISIFGRGDAPVKPWSTYLVAGLIGRLSSSPETCLLRAYVHPCVSSRNLMLVDSNYERGTLKIIHNLQVEYSGLIDVNVRKPLTDIGNQQICDNISDEDAAVEAERHGAPKVLVPDFILEFPQFAKGKADIIVETLGFSWPSYRDDKDVTIPAMQAALGGIAAIEHDFHFPQKEHQAQRNDRFENRLRTMIEERVRKLRS
ncbi:hypothetical protein G6N76_03365 [Rhizobium daejeonense]|uniref:Uncharacterized protein n=1 Tax=Rhizobium daejeonense TaxID=240521 RepID=A0A6M1S0T8_9HYPH|nr:hypothetical protein [Rhizobium daejeonense]NGO62700.1 hypothetical protein [Rhizobium daejeonense]